MGKIIGITRVRNEEHIIQDVLDHVGTFVDTIIVSDDCSTDKTVQICKAHPKVSMVIENEIWAEDPIGRNEAEGDLRQVAYDEAVRKGAEWVYCFDADEFADFKGIDFTGDAYRMRLFDFYITPEDINKSYKERRWMGPEYRDILMLFKVSPGIRFYQREPTIPNIKNLIVTCAGFVKHYGKAISVAEWDKTCQYYIKHRGGEHLPKFTRKWKDRIGKAVHEKSDFGEELIVWGQKEAKGIRLIDNL